MTFRPALIRQTATWISVLVTTSFALTSMVSAQAIHTTGPRSKNTIKLNTNIKCEVKNKNDITVKNKNDQEAKSGNAVVQDNNHGGSAISGDATNQNDTALNVDVDNSNSLAVLDACALPSVAPCRSVCNASRSFRSNVNAVRAANAFIPSAAAVAAPAAALTGVGGAGGGAPIETPLASLPAEVAAAPILGPEEASFASAAACDCLSCGCGGYGGVGASREAFIGNTGPHSTNTITEKVTDTTTVTNTNNISVNNTNQQTANSGTARVTDNTFGGDAGSGSSFNGNSTELGVSVAN